MFVDHTRRNHLPFNINANRRSQIAMYWYRRAIAVTICAVGIGSVYAVTKEPANGPELVKFLADEYGVGSRLDNDGNIFWVDYIPADPTDDDVRKVVGHLSRIKTLQFVAISNCNLDKKLLKKLGRLPQLASLDLAGCRLRDEDLEALKDFSSLVQLNLGLTPITDDGLDYIQSLKKLKFLHLSGTKITGTGFEHLQSLPQLQYLYLSLTPITDESMKALGKVYSLHSLDLRNTSISEEGIKHLTGLYLMTNLVTEARADEKFRTAHAAARAAAEKKGLVPKNHPQLTLISR